MELWQNLHEVEVYAVFSLTMLWTRRERTLAMKRTAYGSTGSRFYRDFSKRSFTNEENHKTFTHDLNKTADL